MIRRIRDLLYEQGFTISGARNKLHEIVQTERDKRRNGEVMLAGIDLLDAGDSVVEDFPDSVGFTDSAFGQVDMSVASVSRQKLELMRRELCEIRDLLVSGY